MTDSYREWDAAYLMGSLSPAERREYEAHLADCPDCAREVGALAGLSGVLALVPPERALALAGQRPPGPAPNALPPDPAPNLLPRLAAASRRCRRRERIRAAALAAAAAAVAAVIVWVLPPAGPSSGPGVPPSGDARTVELARTRPVPLSAGARLVRESWGTRIEANCRYDVPSGSRPPRMFEYAMYVTDRAGKATKVATWLSSPGTEITASATILVGLDQLVSIDIRATRTGTVLLHARL